ncbi:MAG: gas vesicle protein GvpG [Planctomycetota bacterium]|nr:gas vesicle protein GvpG [Planctomycetota bacterium]
MLILDDILFSPVRGLGFIMKQIHEAVQKEMAGEGDRLRDQLRESYQMLEAGKISEEEFAAREGPLLDRLDAIQAAENPEVDESETPE